MPTPTLVLRNLSWQKVLEKSEEYVGRDLLVDASGRHWRGPISGIVRQDRGLMHGVNIACIWLAYREDLSGNHAWEWRNIPDASPFCFQVFDLQRYELVPCVHEGSLQLTGLGTHHVRILKPGDNLPRPNEA